MSKTRTALAAAGATIALTLTACSGTAAEATPTTKTVTVERTPKSCLRALHNADQLIRLEATALTWAGEAIQYAVRGDAAGIKLVTQRLHAMTAEATAIRAKYDRHATACRGKAA